MLHFYSMFFAANSLGLSSMYDAVIWGLHCKCPKNGYTDIKEKDLQWIYTFLLYVLCFVSETYDVLFLLMIVTSFELLCIYTVWTT